LSFAEFITVCNTAIDNSLYHYCTQCHQFCGSPGFVCNKAVISQLHWRKSVLWFISNSVCSCWNVDYMVKYFKLLLSLHRALCNLYIVHSPTIALFIKLG